jgi:indole-3-glycerol phosphate synthase
MFLEKILKSVQERVEVLRPQFAELDRQARTMPPSRPFKQALVDPPGTLHIIAECKHRSPSRGWLTPHYDPVAQALAYQERGAQAISVLTEPEFFNGALEHLSWVHQAVTIPVLRKDFVIDPAQVAQARVYGADAVLLIVRIVSDRGLLSALHQYARELGLEVLVEIHSERELDVALSLDAEVVGVNNRDLDTFVTDLSFSQRMATQLGPSVVKISESGIQSVEDLLKVQSWGYHAALIGEALMRGTDMLGAWQHGQR